MNTKITLNTIFEESHVLSSNLAKVLCSLPSIDSNKEAILSALDANIPFSSSDYDDIIPRDKYVYFTNAYIPEDSVKMLKEDYKKIIELPFDFSDNPDVDNPYDVELKKEHYEIAKRIEKFSLNIDSEELLRPKNHDTEEREIDGEKVIFEVYKAKHRVALIVSLIDEYENETTQK